MLDATVEEVRLLRVGAVGQLAIAVVVQSMLTTFHHAYQAGIDLNPRLLQAGWVSNVIMVATLALLAAYSRTRSARLLVWLSAVVGVWWIFGQGIFEGIYAHLLKDVLYFVFAVPPDALPRFGAAMFGKLSEVPADPIAEGSGALMFPVGLWLTAALLRLHREARYPATDSAR